MRVHAVSVTMTMPKKRQRFGVVTNDTKYQCALKKDLLLLFSSFQNHNDVHTDADLGRGVVVADAKNAGVGVRGREPPYV